MCNFGIITTCNTHWIRPQPLFKRAKVISFHINVRTSYNNIFQSKTREINEKTFYHTCTAKTNSFMCNRLQAKHVRTRKMLLYQKRRGRITCYLIWYELLLFNKQQMKHVLFLFQTELRDGKWLLIHFGKIVYELKKFLLMRTISIRLQMLDKLLLIIMFEQNCIPSSN